MSAAEYLESGTDWLAGHNESQQRLWSINQKGKDVIFV